MITLDKIKVNDKVIIEQVGGTQSLKRRLLDLGFIPGEEVACVLISPFQDPKAYLIHSNIIALRNKDARNIEVYYEGN